MQCRLNRLSQSSCEAACTRLFLCCFLARLFYLSKHGESDYSGMAQCSAAETLILTLKCFAFALLTEGKVGAVEAHVARGTWPEFFIFPSCQSWKPRMHEFAG